MSGKKPSPLKGKPRSKSPKVYNTSKKEKPPGTRPVIMNPEIRAVIFECLNAGCTYAQTAGVIGCSQATFSDWVARGRKVRNEIEEGISKKSKLGRNEKIFYDFYIDVKAVKNRAINKRLKIVLKAAEGGTERTETKKFYEVVGNKKTLIREESVTKVDKPNWNAAAWWLERKDRKNWSKVDPKLYDAVEKITADPEKIVEDFLEKFKVPEESENEDLGQSD